MYNTERLIDLLYLNYKREYAELFAERNYINIDLVALEDIAPMMEDDLQDKGFKETEIKEIFELYPKRMDKSVYYKLGAYLIALYNEPETFEELKISAKELCKTYDVSDLNEEDLKNLWDGYKELDY